VESETSTDTKVRDESWWPLAKVGVACIVAWAMWGMVIATLQPDQGKAGQFGDSFGGINALFTALAFAAVWWTGSMQRKELALQRQELTLQRTELAETRSVFKRQNFESAFFAQIGLVRDIRATATYGSAEGLEAIGMLSIQCANLLHKSDADDAISRYDSVYRNAEHFLGPYFRTIYHLFKLLDSQEYLTEQERRNYSSLARAQLSSQDLFLLAINAASPLSGDFLPLIEKYGLLKHLPKGERNSPIFLGRVAPEAFMSAEEQCAMMGAAEPKFAGPNG
jgi:hypothetical protein